MVPIVKGNCAIIWGSLSKDAPSAPHYFPSGRRVTNFSIAYEAKKKTDGSGGWEKSFISCSAWQELADYATCLERGDTVMIAGRLEKDKYQSERKGEDVLMLVCDMIIVQTRIEQPTGAAGTYEELSDGEGGELPFD